MVSPIPEDYPRVTAYLCVDGASEAIDFYSRVFGFTERHRMTFGDKIGHCELSLGGSMIMVSDEYPEMGVIGPKSLGGTPTSMNVYVEDAAATFAAPRAAGGDELRPGEDQVYGDRAGQFEDPWGHRWGVATHIEDVDDEELERRAAAMMSGDDR